MLQICYIILTLAKWCARITEYIWIVGVTMMDKNEYREKTEQMLASIKEKNYQEARAIADSIEWKRVKNVSMLCAASEVYEYSGEYEKSQEILLDAYEKTPENRKIVYRLATLALKLEDVQEAMACYEEFVEMAPKDPNQYILRYKIQKKKGESLEKQIETLEQFKKTEYVEKWAYELAKLYQEAGMITEGLEECDDLILWFSEGKFVCKAMELKMKYKPLTPLQQEKYDQKVERKEVVSEEQKDIGEEPMEEQKEVIEQPIEETVEESEVPSAELSIQEMLQNWEETQKENAKMIQAEQERVQKEQEEMGQPEEQEEEESVLPEDVRMLMEELESEASEIYAQKIAPAPKKSVTGRLPDLSAVAETITGVAGTIGAAVASVAGSVVASELLSGSEKAKEEEALPEEETQPIEEIEEKRELQLGDTQDMMVAAKALINDEVVETEETEQEDEEVSQSRSKYDTGFVVQGRYDLEAQSEVGLKAGLTEEQKKLFSYFVPVHGMSEQIVEVLEKDKECRARYGTSRTGNVLIVGRKGSGKTVLAANVVKAIQKARRIRHGKLAIVTAESLNKKDVSQILDKLYGGAIIIENASRLNKRTVSRLSDLMEEQTGELLFVLEDERRPIEKLFEANPRFGKKFTSRIELPVFINDELVTFGQTYAKENGYKIDEMGILALYTHIDMIQRDEDAVTVADVKEIIDEAIAHSRKLNVKNIAKKIFGKAKDEADRILLTEEDFKL